MTLNGYLSTDFHIKSPAKKFFQTCIETMDLPKDDVTVEIEEVALEKKKTTFRIEGFQISEWYNSFKGTITPDTATSQNPDGYKKLEGTMTITHVEDNDCDRAILTVKYEKISSDIKDPGTIMDTFVEFFKEMDEYLVEDFN
ncbi:unnamed protein product [Arabidopsis thaliana]|uniref:Bet v I/Major latex protein domain-containing protein n=2 Tax=Arabidopsis TaxID=3701 RepID=A0A654EEE0_ARATH|nr:Bet v I/Major latex protein [Arabidopsis suecica]VYS47048.1 unnamed protein product [Arabidopsis thaliana]